MKSIILTILIILINAYNVKAAEISIKGTYYPLYLVIPLTIILIIWFFLLITVLIKQILSSKKMRILKLKSSKKDSKKDKKIYLDEIFKLKDSLKKIDERTAIYELSKIVQDFFKEHYNIHYNFTDEEIMKVLKKRGKKYVPFVKKLHTAKYSKTKQNKKKITKLIIEFEEMIKEYIEPAEVLKELPVPKPKKEKKTDLKKKVKKLGEKGSKKEVLENIKTRETPIDTSKSKKIVKDINKELSRINDFNKMHKKCDKYVKNKRLKESLKCISDIEEFYNKMPKYDQIKVKEKMNNLFNKVEKLKKEKDKLGRDEEKILEILNGL